MCKKVTSRRPSQGSPIPVRISYLSTYMHIYKYIYRHFVTTTFALYGFHLLLKSLLLYRRAELVLFLLAFFLTVRACRTKLVLTLRISFLTAVPLIVRAFRTKLVLTVRMSHLIIVRACRTKLVLTLRISLLTAIPLIVRACQTYLVLTVRISLLTKIPLIVRARRTKLVLTLRLSFCTELAFSSRQFPRRTNFSKAFWIKTPSATAPWQVRKCSQIWKWPLMIYAVVYDVWWHLWCRWIVMSPMISDVMFCCSETMVNELRSSKPKQQTCKNVWSVMVKEMPVVQLWPIVGKEWLDHKYRRFDLTINHRP
jgi:hypothetical protein